MCLRNKSVGERALQNRQWCPALIDAEEFTTREGAFRSPQEVGGI